MRLPKQECFGHAEGEPDLKQMCQPGENCKNQVGSTIAAAMVLEASVVKEARM